MPKPKEKLLRNNVLVVQLNDKELIALNKFLKKYKIKNKSKFVREILFTHILEQFDKDYPTLFPDNDNDNKNKIND